MQTIQITSTLHSIPTLQQAKQVFDHLDIKESTRHDYKSRIHKFLEFLDGQPVKFSVGTFRKFKQHLNSNPQYSVSTKNKYLITARIFLREISVQAGLPDITQNTKSFQQTRKHKREGINCDEMERLIESVQSLHDTPKNLRIKAILSLLSLQGLRLIEVSRLDVSDLDFVRKVAFVKGKGDDDKEPVALHPETQRILKAYLRANKLSDGPLFICESNNRKHHRLSTRSIGQLTRDLLRHLEIERTPHGFRHYFVTQLIKAYKGDLLEVIRYSRHRTLEMLQVYNDNIKSQADLPRYYRTFRGVNF